jgi:hypothetical protein
MHGFIHSAIEFAMLTPFWHCMPCADTSCQDQLAGTAMRSRPPGSTGVQPGWHRENFFSVRWQYRHRVRQRHRACGSCDGYGLFLTPPFLTSHRQVYNQKLVYRIVVIVNDPLALWISQVLSTRSDVYGAHKAVGCLCMCLMEKLDKISGCAEKPGSSQSVPVDMQTLIHSG